MVVDAYETLKHYMLYTTISSYRIIDMQFTETQHYNRNSTKSKVVQSLIGTSHLPNNSVLIRGVLC